MVSVIMTAYNNRRFVRQAIESVLMQKVNFRYEIIITDDASSDGTADIINEYAEKYPNIVNALCRRKNAGSLKNIIYCRSCSKGKYMANLECDDYWTDEFKLQKQIDFLEMNTEYSMCFTNVDVIRDNTRIIPYARRDISSLDEYLMDGKGPMEIPTATMVYRNIFRDNPNLLNYYKRNRLIGDRITHTLLLKYGKYKYIPINTATYRYITKKGCSFSSMNELLRWEDTVLCYRTCIKLSPYKNKNTWYKMIAEVQQRILELLAKEHNFRYIFTYYIRNVSLMEKYYLFKEQWI